MPNKNFDGIKSGPKVPRRPGLKNIRTMNDVRRLKTAKALAPRVKSRQAVARIVRKPAKRSVYAKRASFGFIWNKNYLLTAVVLVIVFIAFASGMGFALETPKSDADVSSPQS